LLIYINFLIKILIETLLNNFLNIYQKLKFFKKVTFCLISKIS
jgi:hypothetical protein